MDFGCCGTIFRLNAAHRSKEAVSLRKEVVLQLHQGCPGRIPLGMMVSHDPLVVHADLCEPGSKQCEAAATATIYFDSLSENEKHASGSFTADFPNAGHKEGKFTVKYHHDGPKFICE